MDQKRGSPEDTDLESNSHTLASDSRAPAAKLPEV